MSHCALLCSDVMTPGVEHSKERVSTAWPSLEVTAPGLSFLSWGGFMGGWAASSVGQYTGHTETIR